MYCFYPYHSVNINNNYYSVCCYAESSKISTSDASMHEFLHSDYMNNIRKNLENDQWPAECSKCKIFEEQNLPSLRTGSFDYGDHHPIVNLKHLNIQFSNKCNLGCRMCASELSSVIAEENGVYFNFRWNKKVLEDIEKFKNIEHLYISGGETLIIQQNYRLLEKLIELDLAKNIVLSTNTNCTIFIEKFIDLIKQFKKVNVNLSIDGIGKVQEYIRWPSSWEEVEKIFYKWIDVDNTYESINIFLTPTIQMLNAPYLDEYIEYFKKYNNKIFYNNLNQPNYFDLINSPQSVWEEIDKQKIENARLQHLIEQKRKNRQPVDLLEQAKNFLKKQDKLRKINLEDYQPYFGFLRDAEI